MTADYPPTTGLDPPDPVAPEAVPASVPVTAATGPRAALEAVRREVGKAVVGQDSVVTGLVICLLCRGHYPRKSTHRESHRRRGSE